MKTITLSQLENKFEFVQNPLTGGPPIIKTENGFSIRVLKSMTQSWDGRRSISMEYFVTDNEGLILSSPRGFAKEYNKKVVIKDLVSEYKRICKK